MGRISVLKSTSDCEYNRAVFTAPMANTEATAIKMLDLNIVGVGKSGEIKRVGSVTL
jgi:hypothetical protein